MRNQEDVDAEQTSQFASASTRLLLCILAWNGTAKKTKQARRLSVIALARLVGTFAQEALEAGIDAFTAPDVYGRRCDRSDCQGPAATSGALSGK